MTTTKSYLDDIIPGFDVMKWKEETQAEIMRETKGMTSEEVREYFHQASERAALRRKAMAEKRTEALQH
jgi:hypothetical protein